MLHFAARSRSAARSPSVATLLAALLVLLVLATPQPAAAQPTRLTVASWNLEWFFDDQKGDNYSDVGRENSAPTAADWQWKRDTTAAAIAKLRPDILALQEVENQRVLYYLVQRLRSNHNLSYRIGFVEGGDYFTRAGCGRAVPSGLG